MLYFQVSLAEKHWDPLFPFFWVVCHVCLPAQLGRHILLFWLARHLHIRTTPTGSGTKSWLPKAFPRPETPCGHTIVVFKKEKNLEVLH